MKTRNCYLYIICMMAVCWAGFLTGCSKDDPEPGPVNPEPENSITEREALIAIYNATGGENWTNRENWLSDKPLAEWDGVETNEAGEVIELDLSGNNLNGILPAEIGELKKIEYLDLTLNPQLKGGLPVEVFNLTYLTIFSYAGTGIKGDIPPEIGKLVNLEELLVQGLPDFPKEIGKLPNLYYLMVCGISDMDFFQRYREVGLSFEEWESVLGTLAIDEELTGKLPESFSYLKNLEEIDLVGTNFTDLSVLNQLPLLTNLWMMGCPKLTSFPSGLANSHLQEIYVEGTNITDISALKDLSGLIYLDLIGNPKLTSFPSGLTNPQLEYIYINSTNITDYSTLKNLPALTGLELQGIPQLTSFPLSCCELLNLQSLRINYNDHLTGSIPVEIWNLKKLVGLNLSHNNLTGTLPIGMSKMTNLGYLGIKGNKLSGTLPPDFFRIPNCYYSNYYFETDTSWSRYYDQQEGYKLYPYRSSDFSKDGEVLTLQRASQGKGVNIIFMGEGFLDFDMASGGNFEQQMKEAMEHFFEIEPAKTYRNYFNVYAVRTVSHHDCTKWKGSSLKFGYNKTINWDKVEEMAGKVPGVNLNNTLVAVVVQTLPKSGFADYSVQYIGQSHGSGKRFFFAETGEDKADFAVNVNRYLVGGGFARLLYETVGNEPISSEAITDIKNKRTNYKEGENLSLTKDSTQVSWKHFFRHPNYPMVGIYEGGYGYGKGIWRPEEASIMGQDVLYFNAPSRELFVKRVKELAGEIYSWNDFVAKDKYEFPVTVQSSERTTVVERIHEKRDRRTPKSLFFRKRKAKGNKEKAGMPEKECRMKNASATDRLENPPSCLVPD